MLCREIIEVIEDIYPRHMALEWDNVGLLAGRTEKEVKKIYVAVDATDEVIEEAIKQNVDMIVTHHPLIFSSLKRVTNETFIGRRMIKLLQHDISYYAMHTNYDVLGMGDLAAEKLALQETNVLEVTAIEAGQELGIGSIGHLSEEMTVAECCEIVKKAFGLSNVKVFGDKNKKVCRAAVCAGSGKSVIGTAIQKGVEVLITGDIDHHEGIDAVAQGMAIIDAGHYGIEHIFIEDIAGYLRQNLQQVEILQAEIKHPFEIV